jgi:hypothetical protein
LGVFLIFLIFSTLKFFWTVFNVYYNFKFTVRVDSCPAGLSIDLTKTATKSCSVRCVSNYQTAIYEADNRFYYVCRGGIAYLDQCEFGQVFDANSLSCVTATTPAATTAAATTTAAGAETTTAAGATTTAAGATTTAAGAVTTTTDAATTTTSI